MASKPTVENLRLHFAININNLCCCFFQTSVLPVLGQVIDKITTKLNNPEIAKSREELKKYQLDSPNLPNKAISVEVSVGCCSLLVAFDNVNSIH